MTMTIVTMLKSRSELRPVSLQLSLDTSRLIAINACRLAIRQHLGPTADPCNADAAWSWARARHWSWARAAPHWYPRYWTNHPKRKDLDSRDRRDVWWWAMCWGSTLQHGMNCGMNKSHLVHLILLSLRLGVSIQADIPRHETQSLPCQP